MYDVELTCRKVWDALTGDELHSFEHKHIVRACAFSEVASRPNLHLSILILEYLTFMLEISFKGQCRI